MTGQEPGRPERDVAVRRTEQLPDGTTREVLVVDGEVFPARAPFARPLDEVARDGRRRGRFYGRRPR